MDPSKVTAEWIEPDDIRSYADNFRQRCLQTDEIPVDIELIIERYLKIQYVFLDDLERDCNMVGFISRDFKYLYIDKDLFEDIRYLHRVRFTLAHEAGHHELHRGIFSQLEIKNFGEWKKFRKAINNLVQSKFEWQASEFAGRLLVPKMRLVDAVKNRRTQIAKLQESMGTTNTQFLAALIAQLINDKFQVSTESMIIRIIRENIFDILDMH